MNLLRIILGINAVGCLLMWAYPKYSGAESLNFFIYALLLNLALLSLTYLPNLKNFISGQQKK